MEKRAAGEAGEESKAGQTSQTGSIGVYAVGTMGRGIRVLGWYCVARWTPAATIPEKPVNSLILP